MIVDVSKTYKVKPDGKTDNKGLMTMRKSKAGNKPHSQLLFTPGDKNEVAYQDNRWLYGIKSYEIAGKGMKFRSLYTGDDEALQRAFWTGELLQTNTEVYNGRKDYVTADLIAEAKAGDITVTRLTNINVLRANRRVIIYGGNYFAQKGYPPPCFMCVRTITNISGNEITLDNPLDKNFPVDVWDNPDTDGGGSGKPRIIDVEDFWARFARFVDMDITGNFAPSAQRVEIINCKIGADKKSFYWPSESGDIYVKNSEIGPNEYDKLFNTWTGDGNIFHGSANGGGSGDKIKHTNTKFYGPVRHCSRYVELRNNYIECAPDPAVNVDGWIPSLAPHPARNTVREFIIQNLQFSSQPTALADHHIGMFPIDDHSMLSGYKVDGTNILTKDFEMVKQLEPGSWIFHEDGTGGEFIKEISFDGAYHVLKADWLHNPQGVIRWCHVQNVIDLGGHQVLDGKPLWHGNSIRCRDNQSTNGEHTLHLNQDDFTGNSVIDIYGFIKRIKFYGTGNIEIQNVDPFGKIPLDFTGMLWVKQLYLIGTGKNFSVEIKWRGY